MSDDKNIVIAFGDRQMMPAVTGGSLVADVKSIIEQGKCQAYMSVNAAMIETYWHIGRRIVEEEQQGQKRAKYGAQIINFLSTELTAEYGRGYGKRNLAYYRQFYLEFNDLTILHEFVQNLNWTHFRALLRVNDFQARTWYMRQAAEQMWSTTTLERNINTQYYHRLLMSQQKQPVIQEMQQKTANYQTDKLEFIKNPVVVEFLGLAGNPSYTESKLETAIIDHLQQFLIEMGKGFAFLGRQVHIRTELDDYFIDLVFYNYILKCFVLIDLKTGKITHQDVGQMDMYIRMYDELKRGKDDNPTIGIVLCSETDGDVARFSILHDNNQLFAAKYMPYMPTKDELRKEIERQKEIYRLQQESDK